MDKNQFQKEQTYIKWKYLYYNGHTEVTDSVFDQLEDELRNMNSDVVNIKDSPNMETIIKYNLENELSTGEREVRFVHQYPMLSLRKFQCKMQDDVEIYPIDINNFFNLVKGQDSYCTPKFDGNSMELIYKKGVLTQCLTRGNEYGGLDRTEAMKIIVPNTLNNEFSKFDKVIIRGEVIIPTELWSKKYSDPNKVDNPRNWLAGVLNSDDIDIDIMKDVDFVGYHIFIFNGTELTIPEDQLKTIESLGFQEVFSINTTGYEDFFKNVYPKFKEYRTTCKYALDGIVISFPSEYWKELGSTTHHPYWACAVKFPPNRAITYLKDIIFNLGKDGEFTPVGLFKAVELDGTVVEHASLHNLGWIIDNQVFPGCKVEIAKKGEIIPQCVNILEKSPDNDEYMEYINDCIKNHSIK